MSEIQYVCLSDLHLGEEDSIFSNMKDDGTEGDPMEPGPVLLQLAECIKDLREQLWKEKKPILVLNGDVLELALCPMHKASMAFQSFINLLKVGQEFMFSKIVCIPGNHDHHLWVMTREDQYRDFLNRHMYMSPLGKLPPQWHSTKMFTRPDDPPVVSHYLTDLVRRPPVGLGCVRVEVAYPNFGIIDKKDLVPHGIPEKCVIFHHGQFTEWIYTAMSRVNDWVFLPENRSRHVWGLEKENFAWIDFAWCALGQAWESGHGLEPVYEKALDEQQFGEVLANFSAGFVKEIWPVRERTKSFILNQILRRLFHRFAGTEKGETDVVLSESGKTELHRYVEGPLHAQIGYDIAAWQQKKDELDERVYSPDYFRKMTAPKTTFIFGHTHKPFVCHKEFKGFSGEVEVFNSGGWVVESLNNSGLHGGSIVLVDDNLDVAAIRMYNESEDGSVAPVRPDNPLSCTQPLNPLECAINGIDFTKCPWNTFSEMVSVTVPIRRMYLRRRVFGSIPRPR